MVIESHLFVEALISENNGSSWDISKEFVISEGYKSWDCGYPFSLMINKNEFLSIYYVNDENGNRLAEAQNGKSKTSILGLDSTHFDAFRNI